MSVSVPDRRRVVRAHRLSVLATERMSLAVWRLACGVAVVCSAAVFANGLFNLLVAVT